MSDADLYDRDFVRWTERQANLLRRVAQGEQVNDQLDWANIIEEVETLGRSERNALASHIGTVLEHLMRLQASPATDPRRGWRTTIARVRRDIAKVLKDSPGLKATIPAVIAEELPAARTIAGLTLDEYNETPTVPLDQLTYSEDQVLGPWMP